MKSGICVYSNTPPKGTIREVSRAEKPSRKLKWLIRRHPGLARKLGFTWRTEA